MTDVAILALGIFLVVPAAFGWACGIAAIWAWWMDQRDPDREQRSELIAANYAAMIEQANKMRSNSNAQIVYLTRRGPRDGSSRLP